MATNQTPSMKHRVVGNDSNGTQRIVPCANQWSAEAEAKRRIARGHTDVTVESWDSKINAFTFNSVANNHLITQDKQVHVNEDAIEALGKLASSQRAVYKAASSGKLTQDEIDSFVAELLNLIRSFAPGSLSSQVDDEVETSNEPSYR